MYSLRLMLTTLMLTGIALSVGLSSWMSTRDASEQIEELFDAQMMQTAKMLELFYQHGITASDAQALTEQAQLFHIENSDVDTFAEQADALQLSYEHKLAFQIWSDNGEPLILSDNITAQPITEFVAGYHQKILTDELWHVFSYYSKDNHIWIVTAQQDDVRQELVSQIMHNAVSAPLMIAPIVLLAMLLLSYWLFKPLKAFEQRLNQRSPHDVTPISMHLPSELLPVQKALNLYINRFANALARERRFSADAAHELKTPLSVIKLHQDGLAELIPPSQQAKLHLAAINSGVTRLSHTVEQLLLLARVDSIEELTLGPSHVQTMVEEALNQLMPGITDFEWEMAIPSDLYVAADHFYIELVLKNLLENACKYSPKESLIRISATRNANYIDIDITDNGQGMTPEQIANAVERFYRVNENEGTGAGLGLSICQHIVELHRGKLTLTSRPQAGLTVTVSLPIA